MTHPLFTLLSQHSQQPDTPETAPESPQAASGTSLADLSPVAAGTQQAKRGASSAAVGGGGGVGQQGGYGIDQPGYGWPVPSSPQPGLVILAIQAPPGPPQPGAVNQPGRIDFAPGLTVAEHREILFDIEWFDVRVRRRLKNESCEDAPEDET